MQNKGDKMEKKIKIKDPIKQILDENNKENIVLFDDDNKPIEFEQIAVIPLERTDTIYAIMCPITPMEGVNQGEGVMFAVDEANNDLRIERDQDIIDEVLTIYQTLVGDNGEEGK